MSDYMGARPIKVFILCLITASFVIVAANMNVTNSCIENKKEKCSNWINEKYILCLKNNLTCECEKEVGTYFVIKLDTSNSTILLFKHSSLEVEQYDIEKDNSGFYKMRTVDNTNSKDVGKFLIKVGKLFLFDLENNSVQFEYFGSSEFLNNVSYTKENIQLLNSAIINRGYDSLEIILNAKSLHCYCDHGNNRLNLIWSEQNSQSWLLEIKNDSLFIDSVTYSSDDPDPDDPIIPKRFKTFKWE